ncbi:MAG: sialidase [Chthoniobacter sp.]|jgi:hypothetical protein|nr:sialidase [Chthoniobacter sp.]
MSAPIFSRRTFLRRVGVAAAVTAFGIRRRAQAAAPGVTVEDTRVISLEPEYYHGWPTLARRRNGSLILAYSGGREAHVCPFGRVESMVSHDQGATWQWPQTLLDSPMDDRDAGVLETAKGTLLVTTFTSLAYESQLHAAEKKAGDQPLPGRFRRWKLAHGRLSEEQRKSGLGEWMIRSTDGGITWSARYPTILNSPHGPILLSDGRLLYAGKELWTAGRRIGVCASTDDGQTWQWLAEIPTRASDHAAANYHELHAVETGDGRLIAQLRNHNQANSGETLQAESSDGGRTWSEPHPIGVWGLPSFLLRLRDGRILMSYGYRRAPFGNQARISEDKGRTWSEPLVISSDGTTGDLGYPSTVELEGGALLTVWYEQMKDSPKAVLRQARWRLAP